jgi:hypothetical protein
MAGSRIKSKLATTWSRSTSRARSLPDFISIGTQKGGTTSLYHYLQQHPEIEMSTKKELHYFNLNYDKALSWYKSFFPFTFDKSKITGEITPAYMFHPLVAQRIKTDLHNVKFIVLLRNPVDRAYSAYKMNVSLGVDKLGSFQKAVERELELNILDAHRGDNYSYERHNYFYLERSLYAKQLQKWFAVFDHDDFYIIQSELFFKEPMAHLYEIQEFLNVSPFEIKNLKVSNKGNEGNMTKDLRDYLNEYFKESIVELNALLNKNFSWN